MRKLIYLCFLVNIISCSGGGSGSGASQSSDSNFTAGNLKTQLSSSEIQAKSELQSSLSSLQSGQYELSKSELDELVAEGLITEDELKSLIIIK